MDRRTIFFVIIVSWVFVIIMMFNQPKQNAEKDGTGGEVAQTEGEDSGKDADSEKTGDDEDVKKEPDVDGKSLSDDAAQSGDDPSQAKSVSEEKGADSQDLASEKEKIRTVDQQFISLGSLDPKSPYRFLATFNTEAASVHRLELVQRQDRKPEKLLYKDLEIKYGYLGHLDLTNEESGGCRVNNVGAKTPADLAGLKVGDIVTGLDGQAVDSRFDFESILRKTKAKQEIEISFKRPTKKVTLQKTEGTDVNEEKETAAEELSASVTLIRQPLEVIRPSHVPVGFDGPFDQIRQKKSYGISLFNPTVSGEWKKLGSAETENWEHEIVGANQVNFYYPYKDVEEIKKAGFDFQIIKTFKLIETEADAIDDPYAMSYHLDFNVKVNNLSDKSRSLGYRVDGPNGLPTEDWWFAIKIHGEFWALFSAAGARDVLGSTDERPFQFVGGPKIYTNATKKNQQKELPIIPLSAQSEEAHSLRYLAVDSHYFVSALIPSRSGEIVTRQTSSAYALPQWIPLNDAGTDVISAQRKKEAGWYRKLVPVNFKAYFQFENPDENATNEEQFLIGPNASVEQAFMIFAGPKEPALLSKYKIGDAVTYGWFAAFSWPLVSLLHFFYFVIGNYAIAIILLTVLVRLAMMRFSRKMVVNSQMMQLLGPEIKALSDRYKDDFQGKSKAQQELFKKYNYNPFSGCLVMMIQLPVFIGLYRGLSVDMALRDAPLIPGGGWCSNLAGPDQLWRWKESLPEFFSFLTDETGFLGPYFNLLPIISVVLMLVQQKLFTPPPTDEQQAMMQKMMTFMMVFIGVIFFKVPAGLCIYFITSTLWAILEKKLIPPPKLAPHLQERLDKLKAAQQKEKEDGVPSGTYTSGTDSAGDSGIDSKKRTERAKRAQKNRKK